MTNLKVSIAEVENMACGDSGVTRDGVELRVVEEGDWVSDGKYESCEVIFTDGVRFYTATASRSGSYYSDYTYESDWDDGDADVAEVAKVTKTIEIWEAV